MGTRRRLHQLARVFSSVVAVATLTSSAAAQETQTATERARTIAALERLMLTGDPLHTDHGSGIWLQAAVEQAFARNDREIVRLAQRAARPLLAHITSPVSSTSDLPTFEVRRPEVLELPRPVTYTAEIYVSIDGHDMFRVGTAPDAASMIGVIFPDYARVPGLHHVRVQARLAYKGVTAVPPPEIRTLPEVTYALYDPARNDQFDASVFIRSPGAVRANRFSEALPNEAFSIWLNAVLARHATKPPEVAWLGRYCDERTLEPGALPRTRNICSVAHFMVQGTIGQIWMRTGRVELTETEVKWLAEPPTFQGLRLHHSFETEFDDLSALPWLLENDPQQWPYPDVSVAPEDIQVSLARTRDGPQVDVSAIVRNNGLADVRGVEVYVSASVHGKDGPTESVIVDVPRRGHVEIKRRWPFSAPYGTVLVHAMQVSKHTPIGSWHADLTPEDAVAFRIVNPESAPKDYAAGMRAQCAPVCRGY